MPSVNPRPDSILAFKTAKAFESWLASNHDKASEVFLRIYKKDAGVPTVTLGEALDIALCWGWIDGIRKSYNQESYLQRYSPRRSKSVWSTINRDNVQRLIHQGRMTPHGMRHVESAKADGRWDAAYGGRSSMPLPDDLLLAVAAEPKAQKTLEALDKANLFALAFWLHNLKTQAGRERRIVAFVEMLKRGETLHPISAKAAARKTAATKATSTKTAATKRKPQAKPKKV